MIWKIDHLHVRVSPGDHLIRSGRHWDLRGCLRLHGPLEAHHRPAGEHRARGAGNRHLRQKSMDWMENLGKSMENDGKSMENPWKMMENPWKIHGKSMENPWKIMEHIGQNHKNPWAHYGTSRPKNHGRCSQSSLSFGFPVKCSRIYPIPAPNKWRVKMWPNIWRYKWSSYPPCR